MQKSKRERLNKAGCKVGTAQEFLDLSDEETALIEMRLCLAANVKKRRHAKGWTQSKLATEVGSSQSRVAKLEAADPTVSLELFIRALLTLGASRREVGRIVGDKSTVPAA